MAERQKSPREIRKLDFDLGPAISAGAALASVQGFASLRLRGITPATETTNLGAILLPEDTTVSLNADPKVGALIIVNPGDSVLEETFKITSVSGVGPFICGILPSAEQEHANNAPVNYEKGMTTPVLVSATPSPSGSLAPFVTTQGADAKTYRISVLGTCNNGEIVEDETDLEVLEFLTITAIAKQPGETKDFAVDFSGYLTEYSTALSSAIGFVAREVTTSTTVSGSPAAGATSISLNIHPGVGALLLVNPSGPNQEKLLVSAVGAGPPYPCTVSPLQFAHTAGENVTVSPGVTARVLTSSTATIVGSEAIFRTRRGASGQTYYFAAVGTLADGQVVQQNMRLTVEED